MKGLLRLVRGYKQFSDAEKQGGQYRYSNLSKGQSPKVMVISCSDSRVIPSHIFNVEPGDLFVVRNVANIVPPFEKDGAHHGTSAALEFATLGLKVERIIVMGHSQCGGIQACDHNHLNNASTSYFIDQWLSILSDTVKRVHIDNAGADDATRLHALELETIKTSVNNLSTFPFIAERVEKGTMSIHGAYFDVQDGQLYLLNKKSDEFEGVD